MALTQDYLDELDKVIASGELTVSYQGRSVTYGNFEDLVKRRDFVARQLGAGGSATGWPAGRNVARFTTGLD
jgi:hypothetical protein